MKKAIARLRNHPLVKKADSFVRKWDGKLTEDLVLHPGDFGLGKVPARLKPDDATDMICGFCSTGCSLRIHLKDGQANQSEPNNELSRQPRHGLPERLGSTHTTAFA